MDQLLARVLALLVVLEGAEGQGVEAPEVVGRRWRIELDLEDGGELAGAARRAGHGAEDHLAADGERGDRARR